MDIKSMLCNFETAFKKHEVVETQGLCGRIIRGKKAEDFLTLSDDPNRKVIMLIGADGLAQLLRCQNDLDMLVAIGYEPSYIARKVAEGNEFKLVVCHESSSPAHLATWDGVAKSVAMTYPADIAEKVVRCLPMLKRLRTPGVPGWSITDFEEIERVAGFDFSEVDKVGNGYTYDINGTRGIMEYFCPNIEISKLGEHVLLDLDMSSHS